MSFTRLVNRSSLWRGGASPSPLAESVARLVFTIDVDFCFEDDPGSVVTC